VVASYFAQAKSYLDNLRSYDVPLSSHIVPWVAQLGRQISWLENIPGAADRAARMLASPAVRPDGAMFELVMASNYAAEGFEVAFIDEDKGVTRTPDIRLSFNTGHAPIHAEFKRLRRGQYAEDERARHAVLFGQLADLIDRKGVSVVVDVTYTRELADVPDGYLAEHLSRAASSLIITPRGLRTWKDDFGYGEIRTAEIAAVRLDIHLNGPLLLGTKMARLLSGNVVRESAYNLTARGDPARDDPRYIEQLRSGSVLTWQCINTAAS
jgi:hypothetical protein